MSCVSVLASLVVHCQLIGTSRRYHNIRLDNVHFCDRENNLVSKRKSRAFAYRIGGNTSPPQERLQLLSRTVRKNNVLANLVQYLKIPYMKRESSIPDLARTVSYLPNLIYVDLPNGCYSSGAPYMTLNQELHSWCPRIRYMRYESGSENDFQMLLYNGCWPELETVVLSHLGVEPAVIVKVLASMDALRDVTLVGMNLIDDSSFNSSPSEVRLPSLAKLVLQDISYVTVEGIVAYLSTPGSKDTLMSLTLIRTGVLAQDLHQILSLAPQLTKLHLTTKVSRALVSSQIPWLASRSLEILHYEIANVDDSPGGLGSPSDSYYTYLSSSILDGSLPSLSQLYALSDTPQKLLQPSPRLGFAASRPGATPSPLSLGITRPLYLYTKSVSELEWELTLILPPSSEHHSGSTTITKPESLHHIPPLSPQYRNQGRQSVMVGNGFGGFLAVPTEETMPGSPKHKDKKKDRSAWMG